MIRQIPTALNAEYLFEQFVKRTNLAHYTRSVSDVEKARDALDEFKDAFVDD